MLNNHLPVIFGCSGHKLTVPEIEFFNQHKPYGYILFARNIDHPDQVRALVQQMKAISGDTCPILIDQEGGRVARLKPPHWPEFKSMQALLQEAGQSAEQGVYDNALHLGQVLHDLGITVNCAPVCDLKLPGAHDIIGDRSFGDDPEKVACYAKQMCQGLRDAGIMPIIKHIPGHGRALVDSHENLPVVDASLDLLEQTDFKVFRLLKDEHCWAMTAHIVYQALDAHHPVTLSESVIYYIREHIGFSGVLISDDLSMKALKGNLDELARQALAAGCDLVLHCNGKMDEMELVVKGIISC